MDKLHIIFSHFLTRTRKLLQWGQIQAVTRILTGMRGERMEQAHHLLDLIHSYFPHESADIRTISPQQVHELRAATVSLRLCAQAA